MFIASEVEEYPPADSIIISICASLSTWAGSREEEEEEEGEEEEAGEGVGRAADVVGKENTWGFSFGFDEGLADANVTDEEEDEKEEDEAEEDEAEEDETEGVMVEEVETAVETDGTAGDDDVVEDTAAGAVITAWAAKGAYTDGLEGMEEEEEGKTYNPFFTEGFNG